MPKRRGKKAAEPQQVVKFTPKQLTDAVNDTVRLQNQQSEYGGFASRQKSAFCKKHGFDVTVFGWLAKLKKLDDELKAQSLVEQFLLGVEAMGIVKQGDLFSGASKISERIRARLADEKGEDEAETPSGAEALALFQRRLEENVDKAPTPEEVDAQNAERRERRKRRRGEPETSVVAEMRAETAQGDAKIRELCGRPAPAGEGAPGNDVTDASVPFPEPPARPQPPASA